MKSPELGTVVVSSAQWAELEDAIKEAVESSADIEWSHRLRLKMIFVVTLHRFGVHHWVHYREFDAASGRILEHPYMWVCGFHGCQAEKEFRHG